VFLSSSSILVLSQAVFCIWFSVWLLVGFSFSVLVEPVQAAFVPVSLQSSLSRFLASVLAAGV
jgi:hypothetical protein